MRNVIPPILLVILATLGAQAPAAAHCEVPCGIYADQQRFEAMLEDHKTIDKAMVQIAELAKKSDAQSHNQLARWVATKESHATRTQQVIAQYFMTQRIKADDAEYVSKLTAAHAVMVGAMKCKQSVDTANAANLRASILAFHKAYGGKDAHGHEHEHK